MKQTFLTKQVVETSVKVANYFFIVKCKYFAEQS